MVHWLNIYIYNSRLCGHKILINIFVLVLKKTANQNMVCKISSILIGVQSTKLILKGFSMTIKTVFILFSCNPSNVGMSTCSICSGGISHDYKIQQKGIST